MPASPSFPSSDGRGKWKRRKRGDSQITRKPPKHHLHQEEPEEPEEEDDAVEADDNNNSVIEREDSDDPNPNQLPSGPDPNPQETEVLIGGGVRLCDFPPVTRLAVNRPHASVMAIVAAERASLAGESSHRGQLVVNLENVSYGQLQAVSAMTADCDGSDLERSDGGNTGYVVTPPQTMDGKGVMKRFWSRVHLVPMHSESRLVFTGTGKSTGETSGATFFSGKSSDHTPEKYRECRNHILAKYMENPEKRLTVSDCQGLVVSIDKEDFTRIFRFLDHWGIINYCAAPPSCEYWNGGAYLMEDPNGEVHVPSAALKSIDSLIQFDKPKCRLKAADVYSSFSCHDDDDLSDLDNRIRECLSENHCNYCSQPLPSVCYQSQKEVDILLCSDCFHEGRFVTGHSSLDFIKVDSTKDYSDIDGESWSDQETLLLLEAMEIYNENWNEIAEHVGTKSKAQCILHFLRLPVEDGLLENIEVPSLAKSLSPSNRDDNRRPHSSSNGSCVDAENSLPFANSGNPVMALVAFLASAVGPRVAAACAHASMEALSADNRMGSERLHGREGGFHGEVANSIQLEEDSQHGSRGQNGAEVAPLSTEKVKAAAKAGLAAAATKAKLFADHEEREIQRLSANIINHQLKRLELKLKQFAEVETFLMRECEQVEKTRQRFAAERVRMLSTRITPTGVASQMNSASVAPSMVNNNVGNSRQQVMPSSSSQPSISGYGSSNPAHPHNNQQVHSHMSYMQRGQPQPMFPLGTRLPAAAIQPSSPAPSNVMYNASGNSQPNLNQMLRSVSGPSSGLG